MHEKESKLIAQVKLKSKIIAEQEKKMETKERETSQLSGEIQEMRRQLGALKDENSQLSGTLQKKSAELEDALNKITHKETRKLLLLLSSVQLNTNL